MDWRTSDERSNPETSPDGGLARDAGRRSLADIPIAAVAHDHRGFASLGAALCRDLCVARASGTRFGAGGEELSE
jgi:hypothetical protein